MRIDCEGQAGLDERERYRRAWRERRRRLFVFVGILLALLAVLVATQDIVIAAIVFVGMLAATFWFYRFRCPRCGGLFMTKWPRPAGVQPVKPANCQNCGLALDEIPEETKP